MRKEDYYGSDFSDFVGVVEEVVDEAYVRVRIFGIHPIDRSKVRTDQLPPALVTYPTTGGQVSGGALSHNLEVDSWVIGKILDYPKCRSIIVTGSIQGTNYSMSTYSQQGGEFVGQGGGGSYYGDGSAPAGINTQGTTNIPGDSNKQKAYNYIYAKLSREKSSNDVHMHTSAAMGVLLLETSNINPNSVNHIGAWGICQWLGSRKTQLFRTYGRTKRLDQQLDFMWHELNGLERRAKGRWLSSTNLPDATAGFASFERAEEWQNGRINRNHGNFRKRLNFAYEIFNSTSYTGGEGFTRNYQE